MQKTDNVLSDDGELMLMASNNAVEIIDSVRQISGIDEGKVNIELNLLNLTELIHTSYLILNEKIQQKNIELVIDVDEKLTIMAESISFINSVLNNLITNAIKFSFPGSKIIISAKQTEQNINVSIKDFGIGIPEYLRNNIFELEKTTTRLGTSGELGTGFGMPLVKRFILAYGGSIEIISQEQTVESKEHGTEVILSLKAY